MVFNVLCEYLVYCGEKVTEGKLISCVKGKADMINPKSVRGEENLKAFSLPKAFRTFQSKILFCNV